MGKYKVVLNWIFLKNLATLCKYILKFQGLLPLQEHLSSFSKIYLIKFPAKAVPKTGFSIKGLMIWQSLSWKFMSYVFQIFYKLLLLWKNFAKILKVRPYLTSGFYSKYEVSLNRFRRTFYVNCLCWKMYDLILLRRCPLIIGADITSFLVNDLLHSCFWKTDVILIGGISLES